jgi:hypothetical protein
MGSRSRREVEEATQRFFCPKRQMTVLLTMDKRIVQEAVMGLARGAAMLVNYQLVIRKGVRKRGSRVGRNEWDVDAKRMQIEELLEQLTPGDEGSMLKGTDW